jgi:hypothetical protein
VGLGAGVAAIVVGAAALVEPTIPRFGGALAEAGITPAFAARVADDGTLVVERYRAEEAPAPPLKLKQWLWQPLLKREAVRLDTLAEQPLLPNGIDAAEIMYRDLIPTADAERVLQPDYRAAVARESLATQTWASLRTLLEATWKPASPAALPLVGTWDVWLAGVEDAARATTVRRIGKGIAALLALAVALMVIRQRNPGTHRLVGGLLVVCAASLLASMTGPVTNLVLLMPVVLCTLAASGVGAVPPPPPMGQFPQIDRGAAPRISVNG